MEKLMTKELEQVINLLKQQDTPEYIEAALKHFTFVELAILRTLFYSGTSLNLKQIRSNILNNIVLQIQHLYSTFRIANPRVNIQEKLYRDALYTVGLTNFDIYLNLRDISLVGDNKTVKEIYERYLKIDKELPMSRRLEEFEKSLTENRISLPSYNTMGKTIRSLVERGFIFARMPEIKTRANLHYYINPALTVLLNKVWNKENK